MQKLFLVIFFSWLGVHAYGQDTIHKPIYLPPVIINGDTTLPAEILYPVEIIGKKMAPIPKRDKEYLKKIYPYAIRCSRIIQQIDEDLAKCKTKKQKKEYTQATYKLLKDEFEDDIRNMTRIQGQYLVRLINRETGVSVYEIIKEYKNGMSAGWWNFTGKFFDQDLKDTYQPEGRDKWMEEYLLYLDEVYQRDGTLIKLDYERLNTQIPSKKGKRKGNKPE
ncbi:MAG: DUF4294 domain-containing protein [Chitinophagales bacterium]|nr:DUF4294 domain-containing protein [Chitinophagales bacterium]